MVIPMTLLSRVLPDGEAEVSRPDPTRLIAGDPVHRTWLTDARDGLWCGVWESTPGAWRVIYDEWEYFRLTQGVSILTPDGGAPVRLVAGDGWVIRPGFTGTWEVVETTVKDFVIRV
ncbi:cupin domain-containing protein [Roseicyclus sp.]|uniref:cupin domain-containing protein n=1 Tax=Roseicyclus sp. TaxID=1914329 RepID=UPI003FA0FE02